MGVCETLQNTKQNQKRMNKSYQPFRAPILTSKNIFNINDNTFNTISQMDISKYQRKHAGLYKYKSTYGKKEDQTTLITGSLHEMQGNSLMNIVSRHSRDVTSLEETMNESSDTFEIISDGKVDKERIKQSGNINTIDNYIEFIDGTNNNSIYTNNRFSIYNKKHNKNNILN